MSAECEARHAILFEPVRIGPLTAPNRFYQVPHCTGMGYNAPNTLAAMRGMKAAGGWGTVCTEYCSIHPSFDESPSHTASIWDDQDVANLHAVTAAIHEHGSLAGIELWAGGIGSPNLLTRMTSGALQSMPAVQDPVQSRKMDRADIQQLREWHRAAVRRALQAEFDIIYVYACHGYLLSQFMSRTHNTRTDEYGGSLDNRLRLIRELLTDAREEVQDRAAVAIRFSATGHGRDHMDAQEAFDAVHMLADLPDLWDVTVSDYAHEMGSSRFIEEGSLATDIGWVRGATGKPVVSVGRFTSPDTMATMVRQGVLDLVGAARPSIADPFLPAKIRAGTPDAIRECIGCNLCYACDDRAVPIQCTQNPTMGQEWRLGWHPEHVPQDANGESVLVVGSGPSGLEAALVLARRGFDVTIAEARTELGGRASRESRLPGLTQWARVRDYRTHQLASLPNVSIHLDSLLKAEDVVEFDADHTVIATGARWRSDAQGRSHPAPLDNLADATVLTPDNVMEGHEIKGEVTVFDDDHYYIGCVIAEKLARDGCSVTYVTSESKPGIWMEHTIEQVPTHRRLLVLGVRVICNHNLAGRTGRITEFADMVSHEARNIPGDHLVVITSREPTDELYRDLVQEYPRWCQAHSLVRTGDCEAPGIIAHAVYSGHHVGRNLGRSPVPARRDRPVVGRPINSGEMTHERQQ